MSTAGPIIQRNLIDSLAPELLSAIFETAQKNWPFVYQRGRLLAIVSQVSRYWYDVAMSTPSLSPLIEVQSTESLDGIASHLERWKGRSGVHLQLTLPRESTEKAWSDAYCDLIVPHIQGCRSLSIRTGASGPAGLPGALRDILLGKLHDVALPQLEQLELRLKGTTFPYQGPKLFAAAGVTPSLVDLRLDGPLFLEDFAPATIAHIAELHLGNIGTITLSRFIRETTHFSSLRSLTLYDNNIVELPDVDETTPTIFIPSLRDLQLYGDVGYTPSLLLSLSSPRLEGLIIATSEADDLRGLSDSGFFPFPSLRSLTLCIRFEEEVEVVDLATKCFPGITHLVIHEPFASSLTSLIEDHKGALWPDLESVAFSVIKPEQQASILQLVRTRLGARHPLKVLCLSPGALHQMEDDLLWLRERVEVREIDVWEIGRRNAMYSENPRRFLYPPW